MKYFRLALIALVVASLVAAVSLSMSNGVAMKSAGTHIGNTGTCIGNVRTYVFHDEHCHYLPDPMNRSCFDSRQKAIDAGYRPCRKCEP